LSDLYVTTKASSAIHPPSYVREPPPEKKGYPFFSHVDDEEVIGIEIFVGLLFLMMLDGVIHLVL